MCSFETGVVGNCIMNIVLIFTVHQLLCGRSDGQGMWHVWERKEIHTRLWWRNPEGKSLRIRPRKDGRIVLK